MSIVEEALSRLQEKKNKERNDTGGESGDRGGFDSEMIPALQGVEQKKSWTRTWIILFCGLFLLVCMSGGVFWWMHDLQKDSSVIIVRPKNRSFPLPVAGVPTNIENSAEEHVADPVVSKLPPVGSNPGKSEASRADSMPVTGDAPIISESSPVGVSELEVDSSTLGGEKEILQVESRQSMNSAVAMGTAEEKRDGVTRKQELRGDDETEQGIALNALELPEDFLEQRAPASPGPAVQQIDRESSDKFVQVKKMIAHGDYQGAIELVTLLTKLNPEDWEPWFWLGTAHLGSSQFPEATKALEEALARNGSSAQIWNQRAIVAQQQEKHHLALQLLYEAQRHDPNLPEIYLNKGFSFEILGRLEGATRNYRAFLELSEGKAAFMSQRRKIIQWLIQREGEQ